MASTATPPQLFSCGISYANLVISSDLVDQALSAVSEFNSHGSDGCVKTTSVPPFLIRSATLDRNKKFNIIVFDTIQERQLLDLPPTLNENHPFFEFLSTKDNPCFRINQTVLSLFLSHVEQYPQLLGTTKPLILVGHSLGGAVAALFTLWLLEKCKSKTLPLCITFGSPLIGDDGLQRAISKRQRWSSRFLHMIANEDPVPRLFIGSGHKPFGTFLFCSQLGSACIDDPVSATELLRYTIPQPLVSEQRNSLYLYGEMLQQLKRRIVYRGAEPFMVSNQISSALETGLALQLQAIGIREEPQLLDGGNFKHLLALMEEQEEKNYQELKKASDNSKKLNDIKMYMAQMEWYKKSCNMGGMGEYEGKGYYDCYRTHGSRREYNVVKFKEFLNQYWKQTVEEAENKPQKEGTAFRIRFLFAGNNYRRMVEPLDIADYYKTPGNKNYRTSGRSRHYSLLEKWHMEEREQRQSKTAPSLTEDSCFWAYVEDAIIDLRELQARGDGDEDMGTGGLEELRGRLGEFENYVKNLIDNFEVSDEIFLKKSSFMQWWREYEQVVGPDYHSPLADYMKKKMYEKYH